MKKKLFGRLGVVALALTLVSMSLMGGTLAKYTAKVSGSATATVAKFGFALNGATEQSDKQTISFNSMFTDTYNDGKVMAASGSKVVAPGTSGSVKIELTNNSDVQIQPDFTIAEENAGSIPLQYAITSESAAPAADSSEWKAANALNTSVAGLSVNTVKTLYLHWRWNPASDDTADTALGIKETLDTATLTINCTVSQIVPSAT